MVFAISKENSLQTKNLGRRTTHQRISKQTECLLNISAIDVGSPKIKKKLPTAVNDRLPVIVIVKNLKDCNFWNL